MNRTALERLERRLMGRASAAALDQVAEELRTLIAEMPARLDPGEVEPLVRQLKAIGLLLHGQGAWMEGWQQQLDALAPAEMRPQVVCHG